jgi:predicted PhzF superfamily epimerase YddE/YHI9
MYVCIVERDFREDLATGSANAALGAFLASMPSDPDMMLTFKIVHGVKMGRQVC